MKKFVVLLALAVAGIALVGCSSLENKAVGIASNGTVIKIETTGSTTSGSVAPNLLLGTVQNSISTAPVIDKGKTTQISVAYTESQSSLAAAFGHTAVTRTFTYIGLPGESAEQTKVRLDAVARVLTQNASATAETSVASITDSTGTAYARNSSADNGTTAYAWTSPGGSAVTVYTASASPAASDAIYSDNALTAKTGNTVASVSK